jgi:hypothetical protein
MVWNLRAAMNVAALQCQFSPMLMTVSNYNQLLHNADRELDRAHDTLQAYFSRMASGGSTASTKAKGGAKARPVLNKAGATAFDKYSTRTYNGFSTLYGQLGFCDTVARVGRDAIGRPKGELYMAAANWLGTIRKSLQPAGDRIFGYHSLVLVPPTLPPSNCRDERGKRIKGCDVVAQRNDQMRTAEAATAPIN